MSDIADLLRQHQALRASLGHSWNAFFARFGSLRPVQLAAIPPIVSGQSTLVTAPTAGGKTEAIAAPICERLATLRWPGLSVLLITPTRALVNDLFSRLEVPLDHMRIGLGRKTSDHPTWDDPRLQFLVTTPESTESLLTFHREALDNLQAIIIDEVHLLDGTARGDQLRLVLQRLTRYLHHRRGAGFMGLQRVAMSATVADPVRLAKSFLGPEATIVSVPGQRNIEAKVITAAGDDDARIAAAIDAMGEFHDCRKLLVFVNSRKQVDSSALHFQQGRFRDFPVFGHHGSLSKHSRETAEQRFKDEERAICVATMTLEVGIDIGDIDLVVCLDPPFSLASFLQRIGRGCRRLQGKTRVLCVARDLGNELIFRALINQASLGMPPGPRVPFRRSVLIQQVLAYLRQVDKQRRTVMQFWETLGNSESPVLSQESVSFLVDDMVSMGLLDRDQGICRPTTAGRDFIESGKIYSNMAPAPVETAIVDADTGKHIASVASVNKLEGGVRIAGKSYEVLSSNSRGNLLVRGGGEFQVSPKYHTSFLPYAFDIGASLAHFLDISPGRVACVRTGDGLAIFTWLGQLLNLALSEGLRVAGVSASAKPFYLRMAVSDVARVIPVLRQSVEHSCQQNPFRNISIRKTVDLGPYFDLLSPQAQTRSQEDWLDQEFLKTWSQSLTIADEVPPDSTLGQLLVSLG